MRTVGTVASHRFLARAHHTLEMGSWLISNY
jgi:hypothetical protein